MAVACAEEPWLWHGRLGHLNFDALGRLGRMVTGMPSIKHVGELCHSYLAGKERRLPFPKAAKYHAAERLRAGPRGPLWAHHAGDAGRVTLLSATRGRQQQVHVAPVAVRQG